MEPVKSLSTWLTTAFMILSVSLVCAQKDVDEIMTEFAGQTNIKNFQGRELKADVLLNSLKKSKLEELASKKELLSEGFKAIKRTDPKGIFSGLLGLKEGKFEKKYDKSKKLISKVLNTMGIPVGHDPLQDVLDAGVVASAGSTFIASDFRNVAASNLDRILAGTKSLKDALSKSEANTYKAILRNILLIKQGLGALGGEAKAVEEEYCKPAFFIPPARKPAEYRGPGMKLTFKTGECALDFKKDFLDWQFDLFCDKPSLTYTKTPPMFVSEHATPAMFQTRKCKHEKANFGEVEAVLHTFDGSALIHPGVLRNALFSNSFPAGARLIKGDWNGYGLNNTVTDLFGSLIGWDLGVFDLKSKKKWDLLDIGATKGLRGAKDDILGLFTSKLSKIPSFLKKKH